MIYPITRYPDSLILQKLRQVGDALSVSEWRVALNNEGGELFAVQAKKNSADPWISNQVATKLAKGAGCTGTSFNFLIDGNHAAQITRQTGQSFDNLNIEHSWFGSIGDERNRIRYIDAVEHLTSAFGVSSSAPVPIALSSELNRFVETRDQSLARLEELYARFSRGLIEDRQKLVEEINAQTVVLNNKHSERDAVLSAAFSEKEAELIKREGALREQLKTIDDRGAKHARRALRDSIITELTKRDTTFKLTAGTQRLRWPVASILVIAGILFVVGLWHTTTLAGEVFKLTSTLVETTTGQLSMGRDWVLVYFILKSFGYTAGLVAVIWYGIRWSNRWFREHANEEFKAKTMQIDILRANWVVETLLEWKLERGEQIPVELLDRLTHNLFRYPEEHAGTPDASGLASLLLGSAAKVRLNVGNGNELELTRAGANKLSKSISAPG